MRHIHLFLICTLVLSACGEQQTSNKASAPKAVEEKVQPSDTVGVAEQVSESERLNAWFEGQYEAELMQSPIELTFQGRKERYDEIDDMRPLGVPILNRRRGREI